MLGDVAIAEVAERGGALFVGNGVAGRRWGAEKVGDGVDGKARTENGGDEVRVMVWVSESEREMRRLREVSGGKWLGRREKRRRRESGH